MDGCPVCGANGCGCVLTNTVAYVRASIGRELQYFKHTREALTEQLDRAGAEATGHDRLTGLIHRYWIRHLALEDFLADFDQAVARAAACDGAVIEITQRQSVPGQSG